MGKDGEKLLAAVVLRGCEWQGGVAGGPQPSRAQRGAALDGVDRSHLARRPGMCSSRDAEVWCHAEMQWQSWDWLKCSPPAAS